jgi:hypothetical protein
MIAWFRMLENAQSPAQVVSIARDYLSEWTPQELARLPERCRPGKLRDEHDIEELHSKLVEEYRNTEATGEELATIQQLTSFLVRASIRIAELVDSPPGGGSGDPEPVPKRSVTPS